MDLGMPELLFIFFIALLIFGPAQLPKLGRQIGNALGEFKRASNEFKNQLEDEVRRLEDQEEKKAAPPPEPPSGTVAKGSAEPLAPGEAIDFSRLSHDPAWEDPRRTIKPQADAPASPEAPAAPKAAGDHVA